MGVSRFDIRVELRVEVFHAALRRALEELITAEPALPPADLPSGNSPLPVESHLARQRRSLAIAGVVENVLVRPLDPTVKLPEHSRVIIVAS